MKRRAFIKLSSLALLSNTLVLDTHSKESQKALVWEISGNSGKSVKELFVALGGLKKIMTQDPARATVLIKPNLCLPHQAKLATISSPQVVDALCTYLIESGVKKIIIADHTLQATAKFKNFELNQIVTKYPQVKLVLANQQRMYQPVTVPGKVLQTTEILKMLSHVDFFINLATAKHHSATHVSLAVKNLMGLIWNRTEFHTRLDLAQSIADLALVLRPGLNLVDASRVLLNGGPTGPGQVIQDDRLFASYDILALDAVVLSNYNFGGKNLSAEKVAHLMAAYQNKTGEIDTRQIQIEKLKA
jgi:uncharacterized protein (DUF362 family)